MAVNIDNLLSRLRKVRKSGENSWSACCPAHEDSSPSMSVKLTHDGRILLHDFGGCGTDAILGALGLQFSDLFPEPLKLHLPRVSVPFSAHDALACLQREAGVVMLVASDIAERKPITPELADRAAEAAGRIYAAMEVIRA